MGGKKKEVCAGCGKAPKDGCSRWPCPSRRSVTAQPGGHLSRDVLVAGTYRATPTKHGNES